MNTDGKTCPQCAATFDTSSNCGVFCALSGTCGMIRCPRCSHEFPDLERSFLARVLTKWLKRSCETSAPGNGRLRAVSDLKTGESGTIAEVRSKVVERASELLTFGVAPGTVIVVLQHHPEIVVKIGETTLAIEREVASDILIRS